MKMKIDFKLHNHSRYRKDKISETEVGGSSKDADICEAAPLLVNLTGVFDEADGKGRVESPISANRDIDNENIVETDAISIFAVDDLIESQDVNPEVDQDQPLTELDLKKLFEKR